MKDYLESLAVKKEGHDDDKIRETQAVKEDRTDNEYGGEGEPGAKGAQGADDIDIKNEPLDIE